MPRLYNKRGKVPKKAVYVGRPTKWGNPFVEGPHGTRLQVVRKYEKWLLKQPELMAALDELKGKDLVCWCAPKLCHGEVLLRLANKVQEQE